MANWVHINGIARMTFHEHFYSKEEKQKFIDRLEEYKKYIEKKCKNKLRIKFNVNIIHKFDTKYCVKNLDYSDTDSEILVSFFADIESANNEDKKYSDYFENVFHQSKIYWHAGIVEIIDDYNGRDIIRYNWERQYKYEEEKEEE